MIELGVIVWLIWTVALTWRQRVLDRRIRDLSDDMYNLTRSRK